MTLMTIDNARFYPLCFSPLFIVCLTVSLDLWHVNERSLLAIGSHYASVSFRIDTSKSSMASLGCYGRTEGGSSTDHMGSR
jgi:hypothetical protein